MICAQKPKSATAELAWWLSDEIREDPLTQLDVALHRQENVIGFDVTVNDTLRVQVLETIQCLANCQHPILKPETVITTNLAANRGNLSFAHDVECHHVSETTAFHVLHHNPQIQTVEVAFQEVDNVLVLAILHDKDLVDDQVLLGLKVQVHLLYGHTVVGSSLVGSEDTTRCTLTDLVEVVVQLGRITRPANGQQALSHVHGIALALTLPGPSCRWGP